MNAITPCCPTCSQPYVSPGYYPGCGCPPVCNYPPPPPPSPAPIRGPILGVTDGSDAKPGEVGEFVTGSAQFDFAATGVTGANLAPLVLQPGDWNIGGSLRTFTGLVAGGQFFFDPIPPGTTGALWAGQWHTNAVEAVVLVSPVARGLFSVPTLITIHCDIIQATGGSAGTAVLTVSARRMR